ncbi:MAG TPA: hypothetical protein DEB52_15775, partial [Hyphomonas sp.]|nr:hypothetical protein [Hyphomonas sp.]
MGDLRHFCLVLTQAGGADKTARKSRRRTAPYANYSHFHLHGDLPVHPGEIFKFHSCNKDLSGEARFAQMHAGEGVVTHLPA